MGAGAHGSLSPDVLGFFTSTEKAPSEEEEKEMRYKTINFFLVWRNALPGDNSCNFQMQEKRSGEGP